jgi:hypothetical protein
MLSRSIRGVRVAALRGLKVTWVMACAAALMLAAGAIHGVAPANAKTSCSSHRVSVVAINGGLPGVTKAHSCWGGLLRMHATNGATRCQLGFSTHDYAFDEVSAARAQFAPRAKLAKTCVQVARRTAGCPKMGPCAIVGMAYYGYDAGYSPRWGFAAPVPGFTVRLLELYDGHAESAVVPAAESAWKARRTSYGAIVEVGGGDSTAAMATTVKRVCVESKNRGLVGLYINHSQRARLTKARVNAVVTALDSCMQTSGTRKKPPVRNPAPTSTGGGSSDCDGGTTLTTPTGVVCLPAPASPSVNGG